MTERKNDACEWGDCIAERKNTAAIGKYPLRRLYGLCNDHYTAALRCERSPAHERWVASSAPFAVARCEPRTYGKGHILVDCACSMEAAR